MTVLRPSLPPLSSTTTRMVSLAPFLPSGAAARAVRLTKPGTFNPHATRLETAEVRRKSRRVVMANLLRGSIQLELGKRQHQMAQGADAMVGDVLGHPVDRRFAVLGLRVIVEQLLARRRLD